MSWSTKEKAFCVEAYFTNKSYTVVQANFWRQFWCHHAQSKSRIFDWVQKFREYGTVQNLNSEDLRDTYSGRRVSARTERNIDAVQDSVGWSPKKSLWWCSQELGISWESLRHVLKSDLHLYPYQIQIKQKLMEADMEKCITAEAIWSIFWKKTWLLCKATKITKTLGEWLYTAWSLSPANFKIFARPL